MKGKTIQNIEGYVSSWAAACALPAPHTYCCLGLCPGLLPALPVDCVGISRRLDARGRK
jgi:hypothetical protein